MFPLINQSSSIGGAAAAPSHSKASGIFQLCGVARLLDGLIIWTNGIIILVSLSSCGFCEAGMTKMVSVQECCGEPQLWMERSFLEMQPPCLNSKFFFFLLLHVRLSLRCLAFFFFFISTCVRAFP